MRRKTIISLLVFFLRFHRSAISEWTLILNRQWGFSGVNSFAHLDHVKCLTKPDTLFDIAVLGVPFDTATTFRPGSSLRIVTHTNSGKLRPYSSTMALHIMICIFMLTCYRSKVRSKSHKISFISSNLFPSIQSPCRNQSLSLMGEDTRLW